MGGKSKKKMNEIAAKTSPSTESMSKTSIGYPDTCIFDEVKVKKPAKAKALPDIFNQIIEEKLEADGVSTTQNVVEAPKDVILDGLDTVESEQLDLPMDAFLSEAGVANKEYDDKMAHRMAVKKEETEAEKRMREQNGLLEKLKNRPPDPFETLFGTKTVRKEEK